MAGMKKLSVAVLLLLGACATGPTRSQVLNSLIGQPEVEVIRVLGVPSQTYDAQGHRFLGYVDRRIDVVPGSYGGFGGPFGGGFGGGGFGGGFGGFGFGGFGGFPPEVFDRNCATTVDIVAGRMVTYSLRGNACG